MVIPITHQRKAKYHSLRSGKTLFILCVKHVKIMQQSVCFGSTHTKIKQQKLSPQQSFQLKIFDREWNIYRQLVGEYRIEIPKYLILESRV